MSLIFHWRSRARRLKHEGHVLYRAFRDPRVPWYARLMAAFAVGYLVSPIDLIPDFIPGVGLLDDRLIVPFLFGVAHRLIPSEILAEHRAVARERQAHIGRMIWLGVTVILLFWLATAALVVFLVVRFLR